MTATIEDTEEIEGTTTKAPRAPKTIESYGTAKLTATQIFKSQWLLDETGLGSDWSDDQLEIFRRGVALSGALNTAFQKSEANKQHHRELREQRSQGEEMTSEEREAKAAERLQKQQERTEKAEARAAATKARLEAAAEKAEARAQAARDRLAGKLPEKAATKTAPVKKNKKGAVVATPVEPDDADLDDDAEAPF